MGGRPRAMTIAHNIWVSMVTHWPATQKDVTCSWYFTLYLLVIVSSRGIDSNCIYRIPEVGELLKDLDRDAF